MRKIIIVATAAAAGLAGLGGAAYAATSTDGCTLVRDHITKTDNGHGTPSEWADLSLNRATRVCKTDAGYDVTLTDVGRLWTRVGAGTPNGTGGQITHRVPGVVRGVYHLTVTGGTPENRHGDVTKSSTEYVQSLFSDGATVTGGDYAWAYVTVCKERWVDSSANNDGQGAAAGNITGKRCVKPHPTPTESTSPTPSSSPTGEPSTPPGEAPAPTPVPGNLGVTG